MAFNFFKSQVHQEMGLLFTPETYKAWANLKKHVLAGCLCDPGDMDMNVFSERDFETFGGEVFQVIRMLRGTSALEGFHYHQKQWLGPLGRHSLEAGLALLTDGTLRWNRKRNNAASTPEDSIPMIFASNLLHEADALNHELTGGTLYPKLFTKSSKQTASLVCCIEELQQ